MFYAVQLIVLCPAGDGGDCQSRVGTSQDSCPVEWHPADDVAGHRLLLRASSGVAHLPRSPASQHAQRRLGLAGPGASRRPLGHRPVSGRLAAGLAGPRFAATAPFDQAHDERIAGHFTFGRQGQSARPTVAVLALFVERHFFSQ